MRDINRIRPFLKTLETVWEKVPDWRFRTTDRKYKKIC